MDALIKLLDNIELNGLKIDKVRYEYNENPVPSVTQILSKCISEEYIANWANYLGFKHIKYKEKLEEAANIGTIGHNTVEKYLTDGTESENTCYKSFRIWWDMINQNHKVSILGMEEKMILPYCAGTYDILVSIDDKVYLIDLKTSNHVGYKYFIQLAAYRHMLYKLKNINLDGCLILQLDKHTPSFEEYMLDFANPIHYNFIEHCAFTFMSLVLSFYNTNKAESIFKQIF